MSDTNKLIVIKLDDNSSPLMKDYIFPKEEKTTTEIFEKKNPLPDIKPKESKSAPSIQFDELSFDISMQYGKKRQEVQEVSKQVKPEITKVPSIRILPSIEEKTPKSNMNLSLLAASKEMKPESKIVSFDASLKKLPSIKPKKKIIKKIVRKQTLKFKNEEEDGYKIGYMPEIDQRELQNTPVPVNTGASLSKMERLLGISTRVVGKRG